MRELSERYPTRLGEATPVTSVLRGGAPIHLPDMTDQQLREYCVDDQHAELVQALGARSAIIVPLIAREAQLGALTLVATSPRRFDRADIELAAEMGRRACTGD